MKNRPSIEEVVKLTVVNKYFNVDIKVQLMSQNYKEIYDLYIFQAFKNRIFNNQLIDLIPNYKNHVLIYKASTAEDYFKVDPMN